MTATHRESESSGLNFFFFVLHDFIRLLVPPPLLVNFRGKDEDGRSKCAAWNSAGATATQQVRPLLMYFQDMLF